MGEPADLGDIIVLGNRRPSGAGGAYGGGGGGGGPRVPVPIEQPEDPNYDAGETWDPCAFPGGRREKAIDAAAADALREFARRGDDASEDGITARERGAYLFLNPDGTISIGPVSTGALYVNGGVGSTGSLQLGGRDPATIVGSVHTHGTGNHLPSTAPNGGGDRGHYNAMVDFVNLNGGNGSLVRMYIGARTTPGAGIEAYDALHFYNGVNLERDIANANPSIEVNPAGEECP